ncbi:MAG: 23S rRNA (cytidine(2498)-2'-O)-methyltransferase RlmM [Pontibacterium sp.]
MSEFNRLVLQCRPGFEKEAAAEITDRAAKHAIYGYCQLKERSGYVLFTCPESGSALKLIEQLDFHSLIFIRQWMACGNLLILKPEDRISQLKTQLEAFPPCVELWAEQSDTTEGRELVTFCRKFSSALAQHLRKSGKLRKPKANDAKRLVLFVLSGNEMYLGLAPVNNSAPWPMGIPRLKFPKQAPSRSTLKLEEAWHWFIAPEEWDARIPMGGSAVDLGAAPGGWTWQLVNRSMFVTAVDNGPMNSDLMESGQVVHAEEDAYRFVPEKRVNLMVCDVADKPIRTANLAVNWLLNGYCKEAIFNLKLPMKQRYQETVTCLNLISDQLAEANIRFELSAKQLYHDREEITCSLRQLDRF